VGAVLNAGGTVFPGIAHLVATRINAVARARGDLAGPDFTGRPGSAGTVSRAIPAVLEEGVGLADAVAAVRTAVLLAGLAVLLDKRAHAVTAGARRTIIRAVGVVLAQLASAVVVTPTIIRAVDVVLARVTGTVVVAGADEVPDELLVGVVRPIRRVRTWTRAAV
jgi:hypothetical protein